MRLFQSERKLSQELSRILTAPKEKRQMVERRAEKEDADFIAYLPSDFEISEMSFQHYQVKDGSEVLLSV
jgi:hypothetical protein